MSGVGRQNGGKAPNPAANGDPPGKPPRKWPWILGGFLGLALLVALRASSEWWKGDDPGDHEPPPFQAETVDHVRVWGRADRSRLGPGEELTLWLFIQNQSDEAIDDVRIDEFAAPGLSRPDADDCWPEPCEPPRCAPDCRFGDPRKRGLNARLEPGESTGVHGRLQADSLRPGTIISASFTWSRVPPPTSAASIARSRPATAIVGPLFPAPARSWWIVLLSSVYEVLKDLGLPIVLAVLAFLFTRIQSKWEKQRKEAEDEKERQRKEDEEEKERLRQDAAAEEARRHQTYQSLLPRAHENAVRFLLPMCINAGQAAQEIGKARQAAGAGREAPEGEAGDEAARAKRIAQRRAFYYFALLLKRNFHLVEKGGGYFFESLAGEFLVYDCWNELFGRAVRQVGYAPLYALLDRVDANDSLLQFESRFCYRGYSGVEREDHGSGPLFSETFTLVRSRFEAWIEMPTGAGNGEARPDIELLLELFSKLTQYEINRLYRLWYREPGEAGKADEEALSGLVGELKSWASRKDPGDAPLKKLYADLAARFPPKGGLASLPKEGASTGAGVP